jgi:hypothetical protein
MVYKPEKYYFYSEQIELTLNYLAHKCRRSNCKVGIIPKYKILEYQGEVKGTSIILNNYHVVSRYDLNVSTLSKLKTEISFNYSVNVTIKNIMELNSAIKIDLANPISSGLQIIDKLLKLRAFS